MTQENNINRFLTINIAVQGIIVAALLVWVQYWNHSYDIYILNNQPIWHLSLLIAAIFTAALSSLLSISIALLYLLKERMNHLQYIIGLSGFSVSVLVLVVILAGFTTWLRALAGDLTWFPSSIIKPECATITTVLSTIFGITLLCFWLFWWGKCLANKLKTS